MSEDQRPPFRYYTVKEVASLLHVSRRAVIGYIHAGMIEYSRFTKNGHYRLSQSAVEAFLKAHTHEVTQHE